MKLCSSEKKYSERNYSDAVKKFVALLNYSIGSTVILIENSSLKRYFLLEPSLETVLLRHTDHHLGVKFTRHLSAIAQIIWKRKKPNHEVCVFRMSIRFKFYGICSSGLKLELLLLLFCKTSFSYSFYMCVLLVNC